MQLSTSVLAGRGLVALAFSAPTETTTTGSTTYWQTTQTQKYNCDGKNVIRCEITAGSSCFTIASCEAYCFLHDNGAACVDMGERAVNTPDVDPPASIAEIPDSISNSRVSARSTSPQENKHYTCSKDYTGVLICRYGFCSTAYYCRAGEKCDDNSISCKSRSPFFEGAKSEVRSVPVHLEAAASKLVAGSRG